MRLAARSFLTSILALAFVATIAAADTAQVKVRGPQSVTYAAQFWRNGAKVGPEYHGLRVGGNNLAIFQASVSPGSGYYAQVWVEGVNVKSNTWPPKNVSGTTLLGNLAFNYGGEPTPW